MLMFGTNTRAHAQTANDWTFSLIPSNGQIAGNAGTTIGWGYSFTNNSNLWLLPFTLATNSTVSHATITTNPFDYPSLAPGVTVTKPYDGTSGLADLTWDADAPTGFVNSGIFTLTAYYYDGDPFNGGNYVADAGGHDAAYQATVTPAPVPEASTWQSLGALLLLGGLLAVRRSRVKRN
jgi:hypothetical protein